MIWVALLLTIAIVALGLLLTVVGLLVKERKR